VERRWLNVLHVLVGNCAMQVQGRCSRVQKVMFVRRYLPACPGLMKALTLPLQSMQQLRLKQSHVLPAISATKDQRIQNFALEERIRTTRKCQAAKTVWKARIAMARSMLAPYQCLVRLDTTVRPRQCMPRSTLAQKGPTETLKVR